MDQTISQGSFKELIGVSYSTMDCWGLYKAFYKKIFNRDILAWFDYPNLMDAMGSKQWAVKSNWYIDTCMKHFVKVNKPLFGDIVLIKFWGIPSHIAIYLDENRILHTSESNGSHIDRLIRWEKMVEGYYRYVAN